MAESSQIPPFGDGGTSDNLEGLIRIEVTCSPEVCMFSNASLSKPVTLVNEFIKESGSFITYWLFYWLKTLHNSNNKKDMGNRYHSPEEVHPQFQKNLAERTILCGTIMPGDREIKKQKQQREQHHE
jgi:hypothetical protein